MSRRTQHRRTETYLLPECLDDYVDHDNSVRALDLFVEKLDLAKLEFDLKAEGSVGRPAEYRPQALLKLLIYGYLNQIRSSRKMEKETKRNLEVIWLLEKAQPDHWTINAFRKKNSAAYRNVLRSFHKVCDKLELFGKELASGDGSFYKALNNKANNYTVSKLDKLEEKIDKAIEACKNQPASPAIKEAVEAYDQALDAAHEEETENHAAPVGDEGNASGMAPKDSSLETIEQSADTVEDPDDAAAEDKSLALKSESAPTTSAIEVKNLRAEGTLELLQAKKEKIGKLREEAQVSPSGQVSLNDPDSRLLKKGNQSVVGHNVQCSVDGKNTLIAHIGIAQAGNDANQMESLARETCEALGIAPSEEEPLDVTFDNGYYNAAQINSLEEDHIRVHIPAKTTTSIKTPGYQTETDFRYDADHDEYVCPQGQRLKRHRDTVSKKITYQTYYNTAACRGCPVREACTKGKFRKIKISEFRAVEKKVAARMEESPEIYARRKELSELPFGTMKAVWGYQQFMVTGAEGCDGELNLMGLSFNWKRALNLVGMEALMEAILALSSRFWGHTRPFQATWERLETFPKRSEQNCDFRGLFASPRTTPRVAWQF